MPLPHCRIGLPVGVERNSPISPAPYRVPVALGFNDAVLYVPDAPFPLTECARPRVAGPGRFIGEGARSGVPARGIVRGRPPAERPACDGVNCESSLPWSVLLSVPSVCSESALKAPRIGLNTRVGRRSGEGELATFPNIPVSFRPTVAEEKKGPERPEEDGGGEYLEGDNGGLAPRRMAEEGDVAPVRDGEKDMSWAACGKFA